MNKQVKRRLSICPITYLEISSRVWSATKHSASINSSNLWRSNADTCFVRLAFNNGWRWTRVSRRTSRSKRSTPSVLVCPTCRKRCAMKDILYIDISTCIVAYGKKKIDNLSAERDRLKSDIQILQELIDHSRTSARRTEHRLRTKRRFLGRLKYVSRQTRRCWTSVRLDSPSHEGLRSLA